MWASLSWSQPFESCKPNAYIKISKDSNLPNMKLFVKVSKQPTAQLGLVHVGPRNGMSLSIKKCQLRCLERSECPNWNVLFSLRIGPTSISQVHKGLKRLSRNWIVFTKLFRNVQLYQPDLVVQCVANALNDRIKPCQLHIIDLPSQIKASLKVFETIRLTKSESGVRVPNCLICRMGWCLSRCSK